MKNTIKVASLALFLLSMTAVDLSAQYNEWWGAISYQGSLPSGDTKTFSEPFSWRGIGLEGRTAVRSNVSVGGFVGWNVFNDELDGTVSLGGADISGFQSRFVNAMPLLATAHFYTGSRGDTRAYLGGGIGTYWIENRLELGRTALTTDNWHFGLAPEFGIILPRDRFAAGILSVKYNYAFEAGGITHSYWTFGIGFAASNAF